MRRVAVAVCALLLAAMPVVGAGPFDGTWKGELTLHGATSICNKGSAWCQHDQDDGKRAFYYG
jgi:hypothetical protein